MRTYRIVRNVICLCLATFNFVVIADTETVNGITWTYTVSNGEVSLGGGSSSLPAIPTSTSGAIIIPSTLGEHQVTSIGNAAFYKCCGLTNVTIPSSVISIGGEAFYGCSGLTNVILGGAVKSIGTYAFSGCNGLTGIAIPDSVTRIEQSAFDGCSGFTNITIPNRVTYIGSGVFNHCSGLTAITLPFVTSLVSIFGTSYSSDGTPIANIPSSLKSVTITGETTVGSYAFYYSGDITNVTLGDAVTSIGENAFSRCSELTSITIGNGVTNIGNNAFRNCKKLSEVTIPNSVKKIGSGVFYDCTNLTEVALGNGITSIGDKAFYNCRSLMNVTIPDGVTSIENEAFAYCRRLMSVTMPNGVTSIGEKAFYECTGLTSVTIPNSVTSIGLYAFYNCSGLTGVYIDDLTSWCNILFGGKYYTYPYSNPLECAHNLYLNGVLVTDLTIPNGVTHIVGETFKYCSGLTSVTIPNSVTNIEHNAFYGSDGLTAFSVSDGNPSYKSISGSLLTKDGKTLVSVPAGLASVTIPDSVVTIGEYALQNCCGLTDVTIPDSVTNIEARAFYGCSGLTSVTIPQVVCSRGLSSVFPSAYQSIKDVIISDGVANIGRAAFSGCSGLANVTIPDSVTNIGYRAFYNCSSLTGVTIPDGVASVGDYAFYNCSRLRDITMPDDITDIGYMAFDGTAFFNNQPDGLVVFGKGVYRLKGTSPAIMVIPDGVTSIGPYAFSNCSGLTNVTIPDGVTSIGRFAFSSCDGLTSVVMPDSVTRIGDSAFENTPFYENQPDGLVILGKVVYKMKGNCPAAVTIPDGVKSIGDSAFYNCTSLMSVTMHEGITNMGDGAFSGCSGLVSVIFYGGAPDIVGNAFSGVTSNCCACVRRLSTGWGVTIPGKWHGIAIDYIDQIVKFDANGGEGGTSNVLERGATILAPSVTRTGYTFTGWSPSVDVTVPQHDVTYTAQWTPIKYDVTFDANGGRNGWSRSLDYDSVIVAPAVSRTGYTFKGWLPSVAATVPLGGATYTAQWEINQYMVTFNANGGVGGTSGKQDYGTAIVVPTVTRTGYTFVGWSPSVASTVPAYNVTYLAQWEINKYTVTFNASGGTCGTDTAIIDHGAVVGDLPVPTRVNATFLGWFTEAEGGERVEAPLTVTSGMTLYAHWLTLEDALDVENKIRIATSMPVTWMAILDASAKVGGETTRSGAIGDRTNTWLSATVSGAGTMSFWCKVSCEHDDDNTFTWDRLMVYTNDVEVVEWRMDGETDWTRREVSFTGGENTVKWVYFKDRSISEGEDCAWVDGVTWTLADVAVDLGGGKSVLVPMDWIDAHSNIVTAVGGDKSAAMKSTAANGRKVWECYVLGLDPEKTDDFKITSFPLKSDGSPDLNAITFEPEQNQWNLSGATPKLKGKATLDAEWQDVPPGGNPSFRFFTVEVQMP